MLYGVYGGVWWCRGKWGKNGENTKKTTRGAHVERITSPPKIGENIKNVWRACAYNKKNSAPNVPMYGKNLKNRKSFFGVKKSPFFKKVRKLELT